MVFDHSLLVKFKNADLQIDSDVWFYNNCPFECNTVLFCFKCGLQRFWNGKILTSYPFVAELSCGVCGFKTIIRGILTKGFPLGTSEKEGYSNV